jgi:hypothetical protein
MKHARRWKSGIPITGSRFPLVVSLKTNQKGSLEAAASLPPQGAFLGEKMLGVGELLRGARRAVLR